MRKTFVIFLTVLCCIFTSTAYSVCPDTTDINECQAETGCVLSMGDCRYCETNQYRDTTTTPYTCAACKNGPTIDGKECGTDDAKCQYTGDNGDSENCHWTLTCPANTYWTGSTCEACPDDAPNNDKTVVVFNGENTTYNGATTVPSCKPAGIACKIIMETTCENVLPNGEIYDDDDDDDMAIWNSETNNYDYSHCRCAQTMSADNGTKQLICPFNSNGNALVSESCVSKLITCNKGYCSQNENTCASIPVGYYSLGNEVLCHKCPGGAKSPDEGGAISYESCYYDNETVFTDHNGSFKIPMPDNAKINVNWTPKQN